MTRPGPGTANLTEEDYSRGKVGGLIAAHVVLTLLFGIALRFAFAEPSVSVFLLASGAGVVFLVSFLLLGFFLKSSWLGAGVMALQMVVLGAALYKYSSVFFIGVLCGALLLYIAADAAGRRELAQALTVRFWRIGKVVIPKAILATTIVIGGLYYDLAAAAITEEKTLPVGEAAFEEFLRPVESPLRRFFPEFDLTITLRDLLVRMAERQAKENKQFAALPPSVKSEIILQSVNEFEDQIAAWSGAAPEVNARVSDAIYRLLAARVRSLTLGGQRAVAFFLAALLLITILGLTWPLRIIIQGIAFLVYQFLLSAGFASILLEARNREIIVVK